MVNFIKPEDRSSLIKLFASNLGNVLLPVSQSFVLAKIIDLLFAYISNQSTSTSDIWMYVTILFVLSTLHKASTLLYQYSYMQVRYRHSQMLWVYYLEKVASLDVQYHENPEFKLLENKSREAIEWRFFELIKKTNDFVGSLAGLIVLSFVLASLNIVLILIVALPILINFFVNKNFGRDIYGIYDYKGEERKHADHAAVALNDNDVLREAKIYGFGDYLVRKYRIAFDSFINDLNNKITSKFLFLSGSMLLDIILNIFVYIWMIMQVLERKVSVGEFSFILSSLGNLSKNLSMLEESLSGIIEYSNYQLAYRKFLETPEIVLKSKYPIIIENIAPKIEFRNVSFIVYPGEKVSLVGINGVGKTTIIKLLARFYDVTEGEVLISDVNVKEIDLQSYYKLWGVLFQNFAKHWLTPRENIALGKIEDMDRLDLVKEAARKSGADEFVQRLKNNYENMLSTDFVDGVDLSGGQWQKIGIARGIFANPKLIILDEPTSALDALAESHVFEEIEELGKDATMIIVSHRFATVRNAEKIIVLENGEIVEQGNHEELMKNKNLYHKMFTTQAEGYK